MSMFDCTEFKTEYHNKLKILLESNKNHKQEILKLKTIKDAHIYCKANRLVSQQFGPALETHMIDTCKMHKNKASDCIGDCKDRYLEDNEIKVALGGQDNNKFNYVQLRPNHKVHNYILTGIFVVVTLFLLKYMFLHFVLKFV